MFAQELKQLKEFCLTLQTKEDEKDNETVMDCRYENLSDSTNAFSCIVTKLSSNDPQLKVKLHIDGKKVENDKVLKLKIQFQQTFILMPINFGSIFKNLVTLQVSNCQLESIERENFDNMKQLQYLSLAYNNLKSISTNVFDDLINLNTLVLSNNQIKLNYIQMQLFF